jgi:hypothetical protein
VLLAAAAFAVTAAGLAFMVLDWSTPVPAGYFGFRGFDGVLAVAFGAMGALLTSRRPRHPVGWLFAAAAVLLGAAYATFEYGLSWSCGCRSSRC